MKLNKIYTIIIQIFVFLIPLFFLPVTRDFFDYNKNMLLIAFALVLTLLYLVKTTLAKKVVFKLSPLDLPVLLLALAVLLSLFIVSPNKVEALLAVSGAGTIFALIIIYFLIKQFSLPKKTLYYPLAGAAVVLSLVSVLQASGLWAKLPLADFYKSPLFTPAGSLLSLISFLTAVLFTGLVDTFKIKKFDARPNTIFTLASTLIIAAGIITASFTASKKENRPVILPQSYGWSIAAQSLEKPINALFGMGPGNYINAFTQNKPIEMNQKDLWLFRFSTSSNLYFQILTELGILGFLSLIFLVYRFSKMKSKENHYLASAFILAGILLVPANLIILFTLFILLSRTSETAGKVSFIFPKAHDQGNTKDYLMKAFDHEEEKPQSSEVVFIIFPLVLAAAAGFYFLGRAYQAELLMSKGIVQANLGNAQLTYDYQREAIALNPYMSAYRVIFSQTNFALANLIAQKEEISPDDQQTLSQLVTQSITNAKIAVNLNPGAGSWENLAQLYQGLVRAIPDAFNWSAASYNQAITLDPANPVLRVAFGQLYYAAGNFEAALRQFEISAGLKGDFANGWYNLANAYRELGNVSSARFSYQRALTLVEEGTNDYDRVKAELDALPDEPEIPVTQQPLETLSSPASPSAEINQEVEVNPEEVAPEVTPTLAPGELEATESGEITE